MKIKDKIDRFFHSLTDRNDGEKKAEKKPNLLLIGLGIGLGGTAMVVVWGAHRLENSLPNNIDEVLTYAREGTMTIEAADGSILKQIGPVGHDTVKIKNVPELVQKAFIAIEDRRFQEHDGVDIQGIGRAVMANLKAGEVVEGGSTITQQLARIVFLSQEKSVDRKLKEMRLAQKIEAEYSKEQILERYLNLVYLGSGAYGIADAARLYFNKPVEKLTLAEAATLAGIVPAPSLYSPLENPEKARERRNRVIESMAAEGFITLEEAEKAIASPLITKPGSLERLQKSANYFTDYIEKELPKLIPAATLEKGGIVVETTLDPKWQAVAENVIEKNIEKYGRWQNFSQAALVSIDPRDGQIKAMVGGGDYDKNQFNRVTQAKRQPGSTFKTFVYAAAIASGRSPYATFPDAAYVVDGYKPENYGDRYTGRNVSMRNALTDSINVVAVQVLVGIGWNPIIKLAKAMGIESPLKPTYSLALGASEVNLLELTGAYGTLANNGVHEPVHGINRVLDRAGKVIYEAKSKPTTALDKNTAAIVTWMLQDVVNSGTGIPAQIGRPVAGKTGTSDKARDLWFVGYIPQLVTGIWLGNDDNKPTYGASAMSAMLWRQFMLEAVKNMPIENFTEPNLNSRKVTIKAEPIKTKKAFFNSPVIAANPNVGGQNYQTGYQPRRRSRWRYRPDRQEGTIRTYRGRVRNRPAGEPSNPAPAPVVSAPLEVPVQVAPAAPVAAPQAESTSVPLQVTPPADVAPLAPPAEKR